MEKYKTIVLIPAYNELKNLRKILPKIKKINKFIVLDDCSSDGTSEWLKSKKYKFIKNEKNIGYTANILNGFSHILKKHKEYKYILTMDADGEHKIYNIKKIITKLKKIKNSSIIIGSRNKKNRFLEKLLSFFFYIKFGVADPLSGFKIYSIEFIKKNFNFFSDQFVLVDIIYHAIKTEKLVSYQDIIVKKRPETSKFGGFFFGNLKLIKCFKFIL